MKFHIMSKLGKDHCIKRMAGMFKVSRSGYYKKENSHYKWGKDSDLVEKIEIIQKEYGFVYGSPRVTKELKQNGYTVGHNKVATIMREHKLNARIRRKFRNTTDSNHNFKIAPNYLNRKFSITEPNKVWVSDITYLKSERGWLYLCVIIDLFSRKVVGWALSPEINTNLVMMAFTAAIVSRRPPRNLMFHSDRGVQYCSQKFKKEIKYNHCKQSMSRKGNCWDNACSESFFKTLKYEFIREYKFKSLEEARIMLFKYIEVFYNRRRLHSFLDYISPAEYEQKWAS